MIYAIEDSAGNRTYLTAGPGDNVLDVTWAREDSFAIETIQAVQTGAYWASAVPRDFGNVQAQFSFKVTRQFDSLLAAQTWKNETAFAMPTAGVLVRMFPSETSGYYKVWKAANCTVKASIPPCNVSMEIVYSIISGPLVASDEEGPDRVLDVGDGRVLEDGAGNMISP